MGPYLPEDGVEVGAMELLGDARGGQLGPQQRHKLLEVHLPVACGTRRRLSPPPGHKEKCCSPPPPDRVPMGLPGEGDTLAGHGDVRRHSPAQPGSLSPLFLGISNKIWGPPMLARMPNTGWGLQCQRGTPDVGWDPQNPPGTPMLGGDLQQNLGPPQCWPGCLTLAGVPSAGQDPQCHPETPGAIWEHPVPPRTPSTGWDPGSSWDPCGGGCWDGARQGAGGLAASCGCGGCWCGAVGPALTMSNEGSSGSAALPGRLLNGGGGEKRKPIN